MGYMTDGLTFNTLRNANINRLPLFKNSKGEPAHSEPDGSDWSIADWLGAVTGELGEFANFNKKYRRGDIDEAEFIIQAKKEIADVQIYLDILAFRLGINLGKATLEKFNEVSERIKVPIRISEDGSDWYNKTEVAHV